MSQRCTVGINKNKYDVMCITEPLLWFSPSLHTSLQVLRRSLKPTVKLLSVQAAYKEFIHWSASMDMWLGFSSHTVYDEFETTQTNIHQFCSNAKLLKMKHDYATWYGAMIYCYTYNMYTIITLWSGEEGAIHGIEILKLLSNYIISCYLMGIRNYKTKNHKHLNS